MKELHLRLPIAPFSVNRMYYAHKKICTVEYNEWRMRFLMLLGTHASEIESFRSQFDIKSHMYTVELTCEIAQYYTKSGDVSAKTMDISNCEKAVIDCLFLPKHNSTALNLNVDDKYLMSLLSRKVPGENWLDIKIQIIDRP